MFKGGTEKLEKTTTGGWCDPKDEIYCCTVCSLPDCMDFHLRCNIRKLKIIKSKRMSLPENISTKELLDLTQFSIKTSIEIKLHTALGFAVDQLDACSESNDSLVSSHELLNESLVSANETIINLTNDIASFQGKIKLLESDIASLEFDIDLLG